MTDLVVVANPSAQDYEAYDRLLSNGAGRLALVRARSEKWVGAVGALSGLLATVLVVKGPDSVTDLSGDAKRLVASAIVVGLVLLSFATVKAYSAAFGNPGGLDEIATDRLEGLASRLANAQRVAAATAQRALRDAIIATFLAVGCLVVAVGVSWFSPAQTDRATSMCVSSGGGVVARFAGGSVTVVGVEAGTTIARCP